MAAAAAQSARAVVGADAMRWGWSATARHPDSEQDAASWPGGTWSVCPEKSGDSGSESAFRRREANRWRTV